MDLFSVVSKVTGAFSLAAALAAFFFYRERLKTLRFGALLKSANEKERAKLIEQEIDGVSIDTGTLTNDQIFVLAQQKMAARNRARLTAAVTSALVAALCFITAIYAIRMEYRPPSTPAEAEPSATTQPAQSSQAYASRHSAVYHVSPRCVYGKQIKTMNRVEGRYATSGREPHHNCPTL